MWTALEDVWFHLKLQSRPLLLLRPTVCSHNPNKLSFTTDLRRRRCCVSCRGSSLQQLTAGPAEGEATKTKKRNMKKKKKKMMIDQIMVKFGW